MPTGSSSKGKKNILPTCTHSLLQRWHQAALGTGFPGYWYHSQGEITAPQNHRMFGVVRDLCGSSSPTPLTKQGHLEQVNSYWNSSKCFKNKGKDANITSFYSVNRENRKVWSKWGLMELDGKPIAP